jgi:hypothetical protein
MENVPVEQQALGAGCPEMEQPEDTFYLRIL